MKNKSKILAVVWLTIGVSALIILGIQLYFNPEFEIFPLASLALVSFIFAYFRNKLAKKTDSN